MSQIVINTINGTPPYTIYVCDLNEYSCDVVSVGVGQVPPSITIQIPTKYNSAPIFLVKIVDSFNCVYTQSYSCQSPTPTPTVTSTPTITPTNTITSTQTPTVTKTSVTPTVTPTNTKTPTNTATNTVTPSVTATNTKTPSNTPTNTSTPTVTNTSTPTVTPTNTITRTNTPSNSPTPSVTESPFTSPTNTPSNTVTPSNTATNTPTPSVTPTLQIPTRFNSSNKFLIFAESTTDSQDLAEYMSNSGSTFLGFSNGSLPSPNQNDFNYQLNLYMDFLNFRLVTKESRIFTNINYEKRIAEGNYDVDRNFDLTKIPSNIAPSNAWYTIFISTGLTLSEIQTSIGYGVGQSQSLTQVEFESSYYNLYVTYTGSSLPKDTYRVYFTYPSSDLFFNNTGQDLYFKGLTLS